MLDPSLYSLTFHRTASGIDLVEPRTDLRAYSIEWPRSGALRVCDGISAAELATVKQIGPKSKLVALQSPTSELVLNSVGFASWEQTIRFEKHVLSWVRELKLAGGVDRGYSLAVVRKPDPDIELATYSPSSDRWPGQLQFLDYNIARLQPLEDRKGLEIAIVACLASFLDPTTSDDRASPVNATPSKPAGPVPTPATLRLAPNELEVTETTAAQQLIGRAIELLEDEVLFIKLIGRTPAAVPKAIKLAAEIKRTRLKAAGEELRQYVLDPALQSGLPRVDLTPDVTKKQPLSSIEVVLSRTALPELEPKPKAPSVPGKKARR